MGSTHCSSNHCYCQVISRSSVISHVELPLPLTKICCSNRGGDIVSRIANSHTQEKGDFFVTLAMTKCPGPDRVGERDSLSLACRAPGPDRVVERLRPLFSCRARAGRTGLCYRHCEARCAEAISSDNKSPRAINFVKLFKSINQERAQRVSLAPLHAMAFIRRFICGWALVGSNYRWWQVCLILNYGTEP